MNYLERYPEGLLEGTLYFLLHSCLKCNDSMQLMLEQHRLEAPIPVQSKIHIQFLPLQKLNYQQPTDDWKPYW